MTDRFKYSPSSRVKKALAICLLAMLTACAEEDPQQFIQEGKALFEKGDLEGARVQFKNALQANPKLAEAYYGMALLDEKKPDYVVLRKDLQEVVVLDPSHYDAQVKLGFLLAEQKDKAREQLAIVKKLDAENINTILLEAKILYAEGSKAEALQQLDRVLAKDATNTDAVWLQASIFQAQKRYDDALIVLNAAIEAHPDNLGLGLLKVLVHKEQKQFDDVLRDYEELIAKHPEDKKLRNDKALTLAKIGKLDEAEQALRDAVSNDPADVGLKLTLINFIETRDAAKAETVLKDFIAAAPGDIKLKTRLAGFYIGHKQNADAEKILKEVVVADPTGKDGLTAKVRLAELAWAQNDKVSAETLVEDVIKVDAGNSSALLFRASIRLTRQDIDGAISDLRIVLRDQPNSDQAMVMMGQAYAKKGESEVAESHWRKALEANPASVPAIAPLTAALLKRGDAARAEELLVKSLNADPNSPSVLELLIKVRASQKNWAGADAAVQELKKQPQTAVTAQLLEGMLAASQGQHMQAIQIYKDILAQRPSTAEVLVAMARSYEAMGKRSEYFSFLKAFIQKNPSNIAAHNALGVAYVAEKKWTDAGKALQEALTQEPKAIDSYKLLAGVFIQQGKAADVPELYRKGLAVSPDNSVLMLELAKFYDGSKDYPAAIAAYDNLLQKYPTNDEAANNLAYLLVEFGTAPDRFERAVALTERFKDASNPYFLDTYGWTLFKAGKAAAAVDVLKKVVAAVPDNAEFKYHLGEAYYAAGDKNAAKLELEKSISLAQKSREFDGIARAKELLKQIAM